ncbi:MAG: hypothetical protein ACFBZ8_05035 [Opitutales bacterium]
MSTVSLALRAVAVIGAIAAGVLWFISKGKLEETTNQLNATQATLADTEDTLSTTQVKLQESQDSLGAAQSSLERTESELRNANLQLSDTRRKTKQLEADIESQEVIIADLREAVDGQKAAMVAAIKSKDDDITQLTREKASLETQVTNLRDQVTNLENRVSRQPSSTAVAATSGDGVGDVASTSEGVTATAGGAGTTSVVGGPAFDPGSVGRIAPAGNISEVTVLRVDEDARAVVIGYGAAAGAQKNQSLVLLKDGKLFAKLELLEVVPEASVAFISRESPRIPREGESYTVIR